MILNGVEKCQTCRTKNSSKQREGFFGEPHYFLMHLVNWPIGSSTPTSRTLPSVKHRRNNLMIGTIIILSPFYVLRIVADNRPSSDNQISHSVFFQSNVSWQEKFCKNFIRRFFLFFYYFSLLKNVRNDTDESELSLRLMISILGEAKKWEKKDKTANR